MATAEGKQGLTRREFLELGATAFGGWALERPLAFIKGENEPSFKEWGTLALGESGLKDVKFLQEWTNLLHDRNDDAHLFKFAGDFSRFTKNLVMGYGDTLGIVPTDGLNVITYNMVASDGKTALLPLLIHERKADGITRLFAMFANDEQGRQVPPIPGRLWPTVLQQLGQGLDSQGNVFIAPLVGKAEGGLRLADENTLFTIDKVSGKSIFWSPNFIDLSPASSVKPTEVKQTTGAKVFAQIAQQPPTPMPDASPTPEPTEEVKPTEKPLIDEHDMEIHSEDEMVNQEFMGVKFNGSIIVDESIASKIDKVTLTDTVHAEFLARTIFKVWWDKGNVDHDGLPTEDDFKSFMAMWAKAQQTNDPADWEQVQFTIWTNDLNDGKGYVQEKTTVWPMYNGEKAVPEGVFAMEKYSNVLVRRAGVKNISKILYGRNSSIELGGEGTNIDGSGHMYEYTAVPAGQENNVNTINGVISSIPWWYRKNTGGTEILVNGTTIDKTLYNLLENVLQVLFS